MDKNKLRPLVNSPAWPHFLEWLAEEERIALQNLKQAESPPLLYRAQGYSKCIDRLKALKDNVNVE